MFKIHYHMKLYNGAVPLLLYKIQKRELKGKHLLSQNSQIATSLVSVVYQLASKT